MEQVSCVDLSVACMGEAAESGCSKCSDGECNIECQNCYGNLSIATKATHKKCNQYGEMQSQGKCGDPCPQTCREFRKVCQVEAVKEGCSACGDGDGCSKECKDCFAKLNSKDDLLKIVKIPGCADYHVVLELGLCDERDVCLSDALQRRLIPGWFREE